MLADAARLRFVSGRAKSPPHPERASHAHRHGEVFNPDKGFGFIQPEGGGEDVFVHITAVQAAGLNGLDEGQRVTFEVVRERGKQAAANLKPA